MVSSAFADGKIVVGSYAANPPWEFKNEKGVFEGFEVDVATEAAKRLGMDVEFQPLGFQALFAATSSGRVDFAISSISVTNERLKTQSFTQPYYDSDGTIVGKADSSVKTLEDLKGKVIGVVAGTTGESWAKENAEKLGIADVKSYAAQQDLAGFQYAIQKMPALKVLVRIPTGERFAMMAKKDLEILPKVNDEISKMKEDGTLAAIHKKWFGVEPDAGTSTVKPMPVPSAQ
jgi:polar amino acid transport system substrate-binding protein